MSPAEPCPCGSGAVYGECCAPRHTGEHPAETAEQLMRSRYSAFALGLEEYLLATWHPRMRPPTLELGGTVWRRLQIVDTAAGGVDDALGEVQFRASYRDADGAGLMHERSRFVRVDGRWVYLDGDAIHD